MKARMSWLAGAAAAAAMIAAAPASAQYRPYDDDYRERDTVEEVVAGVAAVAGAVVAATQSGYYGHGYPQPYGYGRGPERHAADACGYQAQRRFGGGRVEVRDVRWHRRDRLRVHGEIDQRGGYGGFDRYDRSDRYDRRYARRIGFTCTVRPDGRVTDFDTHRRGW